MKSHCFHILLEGNTNNTNMFKPYKLYPNTKKLIVYQYITTKRQHCSNIYDVYK